MTTIGSLFTGYGGLDMAAQELFPDSELKWVSDVEEGPKRVLEHRYPNVPNLGDITQINWKSVEHVDVITGGSPCQDLSVSGARAGMIDGTRSGLWFSMLEGIKEIRPKYVLWENVRGAKSAKAFSNLESDEGRVVLRALGRVLGDLASIGYDAEWTSLRASQVGAPHPRERVFVLAHSVRN